MDEIRSGWTLVRHQPRSRFLRRCAGYKHAVEPERDTHSYQEFHFHQLRRDPMAMLPFCGYNMGDYFAHWLKVGATPGAKMPKIYFVNWFRKDDKGKFLWPGYGENSRILKWIFERCNGTATAVDTAIG